MLQIRATTAAAHSTYLWHSQWLANQVSHRPSFYNRNQLESLCALNNSSRLKNYLKPILVSRPVSSDNHTRVGKYLAKTMESLGYVVEAKPFTVTTPVGMKTFTNIIATLNPTAPRRLTLACHYDSKDFRPQFDFVGATDSAVPCALLLDVADSIQQFVCNRSAKDLTLQLIFFDGEEAFKEWSHSDSLYGSRQLASKWAQEQYPPYYPNPKRELDRMDVFVLLDLMGAQNPNFYAHQQYTFLKVYRLLPETESQLKSIKGCLHEAPAMFHYHTVRAFVEDDHLPFLERGVRVVHLIPLPFPSVWHTREDDEPVLHYPTIDNLATIFRVFVSRYLNIII
uniref:Glutaminyl-peptide cyclotransferase n=1 Tax=Trichuris muris TaxID=70415 RepID=A0A5S6Q069_TRIMR